MPAAPPQNTRKNKAYPADSFALIERLVRSYLSQYVLQLVFAVIFMAIAAAMTAAIATLMQPVLDDVLYGQKEDMILPVAIGIAMAFALRGVTTYVHTVLMNRIGQSIVADIQRNLFCHMMTLDMSFYHANPSGQLLSRIVNDVNVVRGAVTGCLTGFGKSLLTLLFLVGVMFYQDWKLTIATFIVFPLLALFVMYIGRRLRKISKNIQSELGSLSDLLSQSFQGIRLVKSYGMEKHEIKKVSTAINIVRDLNIKSVHVSTLSTPVNEIIVGIIFCGIIIYGGYEVIAGNTTPGHLVSFIAAFTMAYEPMKKLARLNNTLQTGLGAAERVFDILDRQPTITSKEGAIYIDTAKPDVVFENVDFSYESSALKALSGINFTAKAGQVTALVGASGGGKSTIINLIPRFYDVSEGAILIDNHNIADIDIQSLRQSIALVSQDITIFNDTVLENIRYGNLLASEEMVQEAARAAAAHDFIEGFEEGYNTVVGENGVKLSGGQKQRISIARALLKDAPILLLDEATSALDNESEKLVQQALEALEKGRTTLVIAHRLSTVQSADHIIVLDQGRIVEQGDHQSLLSANAYYAQMYKTGLRE